jgi:hypothetical protein
MLRQQQNQQLVQLRQQLQQVLTQQELRPVVQAPPQASQKELMQLTQQIHQLQLQQSQRSPLVVGREVEREVAKVANMTAIEAAAASAAPTVEVAASAEAADLGGELKELKMALAESIGKSGFGSVLGAHSVRPTDPTERSSGGNGGASNTDSAPQFGSSVSETLQHWRHCARVDVSSSRALSASTAVGSDSGGRMGGGGAISGPVQARFWKISVGTNWGATWGTKIKGIRFILTDSDAFVKFKTSHVRVGSTASNRAQDPRVPQNQPEQTQQSPSQQQWVDHQHEASAAADELNQDLVANEAKAKHEAEDFLSPGTGRASSRASGAVSNTNPTSSSGNGATGGGHMLRLIAVAVLVGAFLLLRKVGTWLSEAATISLVGRGGMANAAHRRMVPSNVPVHLKSGWHHAGVVTGSRHGGYGSASSTTYGSASDAKKTQHQQDIAPHNCEAEEDAADREHKERKAWQQLKEDEKLKEQALRQAEKDRIVAERRRRQELVLERQQQQQQNKSGWVGVPKQRVCGGLGMSMTIGSVDDIDDGSLPVIDWVQERKKNRGKGVGGNGSKAVREEEQRLKQMMRMTAQLEEEEEEEQELGPHAATALRARRQQEEADRINETTAGLVPPLPLRGDEGAGGVSVLAVDLDMENDDDDVLMVGQR